MALGAICATGAANLEDMEVFAHPEDHVDKHTQQQMELDEIKRADIANAMKKSRLENQNQALAKAATMGIAPELLGGDDMPTACYSGLNLNGITQPLELPHQLLMRGRLALPPLSTGSKGDRQP